MSMDIQEDSHSRYAGRVDIVLEKRSSKNFNKRYSTDELYQIIFQYKFLPETAHIYQHLHSVLLLCLCVFVLPLKVRNGEEQYSYNL